MLIVAGLSLKNLHPRVWDPTSPYYLAELSAVMVSYAEFDRMRRSRARAMERGLREHLAVPSHIQIWLDNGAFAFLRRGGEPIRSEYEEFVAKARPDWYPIPHDYIPRPIMTLEEQRTCLDRTMGVNLAYQHDGFVPVIHVSQVIEAAVDALNAYPQLSTKPWIAIGGIVPNLLRTPKARPYREVLTSVQRVRDTFADKRIHLFGVGGTATLHLAALLGMDSVDSSGWRNRAARGMVQLPGSGERIVIQLASWRGRTPSATEWDRLDACLCPACRQHGLEGLCARGTFGFSNRATHNLWTLLEEPRWIEMRLSAGTYIDEYQGHLDSTTYRPLIDELVKSLVLTGDTT